MSMGNASTPQTIPTQTPGQQYIMQHLTNLAMQGLGQPFPTYNQATGNQIVPGMNPAYGQAMNAVNSFQPGQYQQGTQQAIGQALSGRPSMTLDPATTANWYQRSVSAPSLRNYQQNISPQIDQGFAGTGGTFSTARGFAHQNALSNIQAQDQSQLAQQQMSNQGLQAQLNESALNRQMQGVGIAQQAQNAPLYSAQAIDQALSPFQQNAQQQSLANYQDYLRTLPQSSPYIQDLMNLLNVQQLSGYQKQSPIGSYVSAGTTGLGAIIGGIFGGGMGAGMGAQAGGGLGSLYNNMAGYSSSGGGVQATGNG